jgi:hypothetical protein
MLLAVYNKLQKISLFIISWFSFNVSYAQEPVETQDQTALELVDTLASDNDQTDDSQEYDLESEIIEAQTEEAQTSVDIINNILDIKDEIEQEDSLVSHFAMYSGENNIVEYDDSEQNIMTQKFDVVKAKDDEDYDFTFIRQTIFNDNRKAWDYKYERIYNQDGKLIYFARRYNTYNSTCAEVAFETSGYYYTESGQLVKKTYEIYDSNNQPLDLDNCWMEREIYDKYSTYQEFIDKYPMQL